MKNIIKELEAKKYSCYQELMTGNISVKTYLSKTEQIDNEIDTAKKAINWLNNNTPKRTIDKKRFNWLKLSAFVILVFILFSFILANAATAKKETQIVEPITITQIFSEENNYPEKNQLQEIKAISSEELQPEWISLGTFVTSGYCNENYYHICNDGTADTTATMTTPTPGRTIAVDPRVIPYGSEVMINGHTYIAEDCGSAIKGKRIDILYDNHDIAFAHGMQEVEVFIKNK